MWVNLSMTPRPDLRQLSSSEKDALIIALLARVDALAARVAALEAENAALRDKLTLPPKTPDNSSTPPSQGRKANGAGTASPRARPTPARTALCIPTRRGGWTCGRSSAPTAPPT